MLKVHNLSVKTRTGNIIVHPVSFTLTAGEALTIVGETGSGKTLLAQAIANNLPDDLIAEGEIFLHEKSLHDMPASERNALWGETLCILPQEPMRALDPTMQSANQIREGYQFVRKLNIREARKRTNTDLAGLELSHASRKYPFELSGGMAQRVAFLSARSGGATFTIADEPTKGLDASKRDDVSAQLRGLSDSGESVLTITHDIDVAYALGGRVMIMRNGKVIEQGNINDVLTTPTETYTQTLINAEPRCWQKREPIKIENDNTGSDTSPLITAKNISKTRGEHRLFNDLSFELRHSQILGISGDSGCGKSTLGDMVLGLLSADSGEIIWDKTDIKRANRAQKLFQDPSDVFSPYVKLSRSFKDVMKKNRVGRDKLEEWLTTLKLDNTLLNRYPDQVSGGELQRLAIARVMLTNPSFIFADEPTSRLDLLTQQSVIEALVDVVVKNQVAMIIVSHDKVLLDKTCDKVIQL